MYALSGAMVIKLKICVVLLFKKQQRETLPKRECHGINRQLQKVEEKKYDYQQSAFSTEKTLPC